MSVLAFLPTQDSEQNCLFQQLKFNVVKVTELVRKDGCWKVGRPLNMNGGTGIDFVQRGGCEESCVKLAPGSHSSKQTMREIEVCLEHPVGLLEELALLVKTVTDHKTWVISSEYGTNKNVNGMFFIHMHTTEICTANLFLQKSQPNILIFNFGLFMAVFISKNQLFGQASGSESIMFFPEAGC
jgi:hypothetical protein